MRLLIHKLFLDEGERVDKHLASMLVKQANQMRCIITCYAHDGTVMDRIEPTLLAHQWDKPALPHQLVNGAVTDFQDSDAEKDFWVSVNPRIKG